MIIEELEALKKEFVETHHLPPVEAFVGRKEIMELCDALPGFGFAVDYGLANVSGMTVRKCTQKTHLSVARGADTVAEINRIYVGAKRIQELCNLNLGDGIYTVPVRAMVDSYLLVAKAITREKL